MTQLILIRHGETVWNREHRMQGQRDSSLTATGVRQAHLLGRRFRHEKFGALYSSDLGRAHQTAHSIAEATGHTIIVDKRLRERHFGVFEGLTGSEIERDYPQEYLRFKSRDPAYAMPGGESAQQFRARCMDCVSELAERHAGERTVVITHGLVLDMLYRAAHSLALEQPRPVPLINASLNIFRHSGKRWHCEVWGDVAHLDDVAVTHFESGMA
jgi:probable phosphoglycerate mutase